MLNGSREPEFSVLKIDADFLADNFRPDASQKNELDQSLSIIADSFKSGIIVEGKVIAKEGGGITISVGYKSDGFIPSHEFSGFELDELKTGSPIEVFLEKLEDADGNMALSYQKAKSMRAWTTIAKLFEDNLPIRGVVTSKVKGGLNVDVGIPAFLPGSQIDLHRVTNFDQFVGQDVTCKIIKVNRKRGNVILSRRKFLEEARDVSKKEVLLRLEAGQIINGTVKNITNYGAFVDVGGIDGLLHITDMSWGRIGHPTEMVKIGDPVTVKILSFDKEHEKISLGIKQLKDNPWEQIEQKYPIGSRIKGRVSSIADYGLFVEIEQGIEGLVHISEISWTERVHNLSKRFAVGNEIDVIISAIDKENRRMSLSIKRLESDPWQAAFEKLNIGDRTKGTVSNVADFGVFVQIFDGVDGLVHVSDISWTEHVTHPSEKYKKNDVIEVVVLAIDKENRRISLGIKQLESDPWESIEKDYQIGHEVEGIISKITNFGAFVRFASGIEGLAHISELGDNSSSHDHGLEVGKKAKFWVVKASKDERKLGLSLLSPERRATLASEKAADRQKDHRAASAQHHHKTNDSGVVENHEKAAKAAATATHSAAKGSLQLALEKMKPNANDDNNKKE